jgi:hypothetical protein
VTALTADVTKVILGPYKFTIPSNSVILTSYTIQIIFPSGFDVSDCNVVMGRIVTTTTVGNHNYKTSKAGNKLATCTPVG